MLLDALFCLEIVIAPITFWSRQITETDMPFQFVDNSHETTRLQTTAAHKVDPATIASEFKLSLDLLVLVCHHFQQTLLDVVRLQTSSPFHITNYRIKDRFHVHMLYCISANSSCKGFG